MLVRPAMVGITIPTLALLAACAARSPSSDGPSTSARERRATLDFEDVDLGSLPPGFAVAETSGHGTPATWRAADVADARSGRRVVQLAQSANTGSTFNLLLGVAVHPADVELSVRLRADSGSEDQGGGLVWRARGPEDYYIARWNPLEDNLRLYRVAAGERTTLASAECAADPKAWHELRVTALGSHIAVAFDGATLLEANDDTFRDGGSIGLWTKADATTSFDDLEVVHLAAHR